MHMIKSTKSGMKKFFFIFLMALLLAAIGIAPATAIAQTEESAWYSQYLMPDYGSWYVPYEIQQWVGGYLVDTYYADAAFDYFGDAIAFIMGGTSILGAPDIQYNSGNPYTWDHIISLNLWDHHLCLEGHLSDYIHDFFTTLDVAIGLLESCGETNCAGGNNYDIDRGNIPSTLFVNENGYSGELTRLYQNPQDSEYSYYGEGDGQDDIYCFSSSIKYVGQLTASQVRIVPAGDIHSSSSSGFNYVAAVPYEILDGYTLIGSGYAYFEDVGDAVWFSHEAYYGYQPIHGSLTYFVCWDVIYL